MRLYYGKTGFLHKNTGGGGNTVVQKIGLITGRPASIRTPFIPGAGVGAHSYSTRRATIMRSTKCSNKQSGCAQLLKWSPFKIGM